MRRGGCGGDAAGGAPEPGRSGPDQPAALRPYANGEAYQNYLDPDLADWRRAYYGGNYDRLVRVKAAYDPQSLFSPAQGVPAR